MKICTRFAPSPTGDLHLGNLRTALYNALLAYNSSGAFLLRIEDTDSVRSKVNFSKTIENDLEWLGLTWAEYGEEKTVFQSQRYAIYKNYYNKLQKIDAAYPCFCTKERLAKLREIQQLSNQAPGYDGRCRDLSSEIIQHRKEQGEAYHLRFRVPEHQSIVFSDLVKQEQCFKSEYFHDFVIQRSDGSPSFLYCNALDDALMGVTHVLRGEDHLTNTAKQLLILKALDFNAPVYGHLPLISRQSTTTPLSKREKSFSLQSLRSEGYLPQAILNYLARLGHTIASSDLMTLEELSKIFAIKHIHASSAQFDQDQLNFWQKQAMRQQSTAAFWNTLNITLRNKVPDESRAYFIEVMQAMVTLPKEVEYWINVLFDHPLEYSPEAIKVIQQADARLWSKLLDIFGTKIITDKDSVLLEHLKKCFKSLEDKEQYKISWKALRAALTNSFAGPDILSLIRLLGIPRTIARLQKAATLPLLKS